MGATTPRSNRITLHASRRAALELAISAAHAIQKLRKEGGTAPYRLFARGVIRGVAGVLGSG